MKEITIKVKAASDIEAFTLKNALQSIATNFNKENLIYIAELSRNKGVNDKFNSLKANPIVKAMMK